MSGYEGLDLKWPAEVRSRTPEEVRCQFIQSRSILTQMAFKLDDLLNHTWRSRERERLDDILQPRGTLTLGVDARSLFDRDAIPNRINGRLSEVTERLRDLHVSTLGLKHRVEVYCAYPGAETSLTPVASIDLCRRE